MFFTSVTLQPRFRLPSQHHHVLLPQAGCGAQTWAQHLPGVCCDSVKGRRPQPQEYFLMTTGFYLYSPALGLPGGCPHYISVTPSASQSPGIWNHPLLISSALELQHVAADNQPSKASQILQIDVVTTMSNIWTLPNICEPLLVSKNMSTDSLCLSLFTIISCSDSTRAS